MKKLVLAIGMLCVCVTAHSALIDRGEGFIYDDVLDITWANHSINGLDIWGNQVAWAAGYSQTHTGYGTFDDWRLPSMDVNGDETIVNCSSASEVACRDNEYGYLFWQYGGIWGAGNFTHIQQYYYWSGTEYAPNPNVAWGFRFNSGNHFNDYKNLNGYYALAVRDGDIAASVVPVPAAVWLFGSALMWLLGLRRRRAGR